MYVLAAKQVNRMLPPDAETPVIGCAVITAELTVPIATVPAYFIKVTVVQD